MLTRDPLPLDSILLDEARAYLRIDEGTEEGPLGALLLSAISDAERFLNLVLIERPMTEILSTASGWKRLGATPVTAIIGLNGLPAEGARFALPVASYALDIDANGDGWVRVMQPGAAGRVEVTFTAGLAPDWASLPEAIRLAVLRLTGHFHLHRDDAEDAGPPAAVAALLRPWRRMRLS